MKFTNFKNILVDTRPFTNNSGKNQLIYYINQILYEDQMSSQMAQKLLINSIQNMLVRNDFLNLSVALALCPSSPHYKILWDSLDFILQSQNEFELQWLIWPLVFVVGSNIKYIKSSKIPLENIKQLLSNNSFVKDLFWFNNLISEENFVNISVTDWFNSKTDNIVLNKIINSIKVEDLVFNSGHEVLLFYVLSYGNYQAKNILFNPLKELSLPLMQMWQQYLNDSGLSIFVNPLSAVTPALAHSKGCYVKKQMQFDIFVSNSIRKIRIRNLQPMVIIATAAQSAIEILITINDYSSQEENYKFVWNLNFIDDINEILQNILNLLLECKINCIKFLKNPLSINDDITCFKFSKDLIDINETL